ncbi:substrate-binding periplasmic protein [Bdellovibrio sp. HCB288]|uniref:substrate-binding periplasmic protein n=1 Tax=Bdellovibrio sp. HCB288 TaxID=3394355 RepID=UPI0039B65F43
MRFTFFLFMSLFSPLELLAAASAEPVRPITIRYRQRPPYIEKSWGKLSGICGDAVVNAFKKARIEIHEVETPFLRQIAQFQAGDEQICSIGWLKTAKREETMRFSEPICDDGQWVVIGHKGTVNTGITSTEALLKNTVLKAARRAQFSFGEELDGLLEKQGTTIVSVENPEQKQIFEMILAGRVDFTFLPAREFDELIKEYKLRETDFVVLKPDDLKGPHYRYMICTMNVPDAVIKKFNKAISSAN